MRIFCVSVALLASVPPPGHASWTTGRIHSVSKTEKEHTDLSTGITMTTVAPTARQQQGSPIIAPHVWGTQSPYRSSDPASLRVVWMRNTSDDPSGHGECVVPTYPHVICSCVCCALASCSLTPSLHPHCPDMVCSGVWIDGIRRYIFSMTMMLRYRRLFRKISCFHLWQAVMTTRRSFLCFLSLQFSHNISVLMIANCTTIVPAQHTVL